MAKTKLFDINNVITTFKAIATSLVTALILALPMMLGVWLIKQNIFGVGRLIQILTGLSYFLVWGYLAKRFWRWK